MISIKQMPQLTGFTGWHIHGFIRGPQHFKFSTAVSLQNEDEERGSEKNH